MRELERKWVDRVPGMILFDQLFLPVSDRQGSVCRCRKKLPVKIIYYTKSEDVYNKMQKLIEKYRNNNLQIGMTVSAGWEKKT